MVREWARQLRAAVVPLARQLRQQRVEDSFTPTQRTVLGTIHRYAPISLGDLAARERLSPSRISSVVTALEDAEFVTRIYDRRDRRVCRVETTAVGEKWIEQSEAAASDWLAGRIAGLAPAERAALAAAVPVIESLISDE